MPIQRKLKTDAANIRVDALSGLFGLGPPLMPDKISSELQRAASLGDQLSQLLLGSALPLKPGQPSETFIVSEGPLITVTPQFFSPLECFYMRETATPLFVPSTIIDSSNNGATNPEARVSQTAWLHDHQQDVLVRALQDRVLHHMLAERSNAETLNVVRYRPGGQFLAHVDAYKKKKEGADSEVIENLRIATTILYLNSGYIGGETAFVDLKVKISSEEGDLLYFRNVCGDGQIDKASTHASLPITEGEKYVMVQWVHKDEL